MVDRRLPSCPQLRLPSNQYPRSRRAAPPPIPSGALRYPTELPSTVRSAQMSVTTERWILSGLDFMSENHTAKTSVVGDASRIGVRLDGLSASDKREHAP